MRENIRSLQGFLAKYALYEKQRDNPKGAEAYETACNEIQKILDAAKLDPKYEKYEGHSKGPWAIVPTQPWIVRLGILDSDDQDVPFIQMCAREKTDITPDMNLIQDAPMLLDRLLRMEKALHHFIEFEDALDDMADKGVNPTDVAWEFSEIIEECREALKG